MSLTPEEEQAFVICGKHEREDTDLGLLCREFMRAHDKAAKAVPLDLTHAEFGRLSEMGKVHYLAQQHAGDPGNVGLLARGYMREHDKYQKAAHALGLAEIRNNALEMALELERGG